MCACIIAETSWKSRRFEEPLWLLPIVAYFFKSGGGQSGFFINVSPP